jgi:hypothetical protein
MMGCQVPPEQTYIVLPEVPLVFEYKAPLAPVVLQDVPLVMGLLPIFHVGTVLLVPF